jgi:hypothetical protein
MADNTDEEHLENPVNNQPEIPADQINSPTDSETIIPNQETENMEVHHHAHNPAAPHHKKNWKSYFWEFLMLFLAVFCGFLAENKREHYVESLRAKEYAKSLFNDLKQDTAEIDAGILQNNFMISAFDSCISIGLKMNKKSTVPGSFYYYSRFATNAYSIDWNESTLTQLLQSGNLRYFRNKQLVDKINNYHSLQGTIRSNNETDLLQRNAILTVRSRLLSPKSYESFALLEITEVMNEGLNNNANRLKSQEFELQTGNAGALEEYINLLLERKWRNRRFIKELYPQAYNEAAELIQMLKNEYHLK